MNCPVHGDIRHLEINKKPPEGGLNVHGDIRHLEIEHQSRQF